MYHVSDCIYINRTDDLAPWSWLIFVSAWHPTFYHESSRCAFSAWEKSTHPLANLASGFWHLLTKPYFYFPVASSQAFFLIAGEEMNFISIPRAKIPNYCKYLFCMWYWVPTLSTCALVTCRFLFSKKRTPEYVHSHNVWYDKWMMDGKCTMCGLLSGCSGTTFELHVCFFKTAPW